MNGALSAAALLVYVFALRDLPVYPGGLHIPVWALGVLFFLTECYVVHIEFRRDAESFSLNEIPLVLGLFFASPTEILVAQVAGAAVALLIKRKQPPVKLMFNVSHLALGAMIAAAVFHTVAKPSGLLSAEEALGAFGGTTLAIIAGVLSVIGVISLAEGKLQSAVLPRAMSLGMIGTWTNCSLGLIAVALMREDPMATWLLAIPAGTVYLAYRAYTSERRQHHAVERLFESTRSMQLTRDVEDAVGGLLAQAREMFRADIASITLFGSAPGEPALRSTVGPKNEAELMHPVLLDPMAGVWTRVVAERQGVLLPRPIDAPGLRDHFAEQGIRDAMVAPLFGDEGITGVIMVANRTSDIDTFSGDDMRFFETLANHASISMQNVRLVSKLRDALTYQTELNRLKDEFVATVSHELRSPLTSIQGYAKTLLAREVGKDEQRIGLEVINRQSERLRGLIEDLLLVSKIESQQMSPTKRDVDVRELVKHIAEAFKANPRGHRLEILLDRDVQKVVSDSESIHRVLANFIDNAMKYSPEQTVIRLTGRRVSGSIVLSVEDEGQGIPDDMQDKIFDRFFQGDQSLTRTVGGAGLGLYICRRLAESIGARVSLERSDTTGSTFSLWLPAGDRTVLDLVDARPRLS